MAIRLMRSFWFAETSRPVPAILKTKTNPDYLEPNHSSQHDAEAVSPRPRLVTVSVARAPCCVRRRRFWNPRLVHARGSSCFELRYRAAQSERSEHDVLSAEPTERDVCRCTR